MALGSEVQCAKMGLCRLTKPGLCLRRARGKRDRLLRSELVSSACQLLKRDPVSTPEFCRKNTRRVSS